MNEADNNVMEHYPNPPRRVTLTIDEPKKRKGKR